MKKKLIVIVLACLTAVCFAGCGKNTENTETVEKEVASSVSAVESAEDIAIARDADFRNVRWGDSMDAVKKYEEGDVFGGNDNMLMYKKDICGQEGKIMFVFDEKGLYSVVYDITNEEMSADDWLDYYDTLKKDITKRYEEPVEDSVVALEGEAAEPTPEALESGSISLQSGWVNDKASIWMQLMSEDSDSFFISVVAISPEAAMNTLSEEIGAETESAVSEPEEVASVLEQPEMVSEEIPEGEDVSPVAVDGGEVVEAEVAE